MPLADISFGEGLLFIFEFFLLFAWIWILISVIGDLFRDHELSGVAKAVWVFFLVFLPFLGVLLYLIVRGNGMRDRTIKHQADVKKEMDSYVREQASSASPAEELHKLNDLKEKGALQLRGVRPGKVKVACLSGPKARIKKGRSDGDLRGRKARNGHPQRDCDSPPQACQHALERRRGDQLRAWRDAVLRSRSRAGPPQGRVGGRERRARAGDRAEVVNQHRNMARPA